MRMPQSCWRRLLIISSSQRPVSCSRALCLDVRVTEKAASEPGQTAKFSVQVFLSKQSDWYSASMQGMRLDRLSRNWRRST